MVAAAALLLALATGCGGSGDPVRIGIVTDCTGTPPFAQFSPSYIAGAELPLLQRGGKLTGVTPSSGYNGAPVVDGASVAGRPIELEIRCAEAFTPSAALAQLRWLVDKRHVDAVVGPTEEIDPIVAGYALRHPGVVFMLASYDQSSTLRYAAPNLFRFELDGPQGSAGLAAFVYRRGWRNVTTVEEDDPSGWATVAGFDAEFCALGGQVQRLWVPDSAKHVERWVPRVSSRADGVFLAPTVLDTSGFIRSWGRRSHDLARRLVVGWNQASTLPLRGVVAVSSYPWAKTPAKDHYESAVRDDFPGTVDPGTAVTYYDEVEPLLEALKQVHGDTSDREQALQKALARLHYASPEGLIHLDKRRQAVGPTYLARIMGDGSYNQFKVVPNVEQTFGGYFTPRARTTPGPHSPACVKRKPPPWAAQPTR